MNIQLKLLPHELEQLSKIAQDRRVTITELVHIAIAEWLEQQTKKDSVWGLTGAYHSNKPLIDDIAISEDPDLYLVAEALGERAVGLHAWEIAPKRYIEGPNGKPVRLHN
jgi:hypothetical protein